MISSALGNGNSTYTTLGQATALNSCLVTSFNYNSAVPSSSTATLTLWGNTDVLVIEPTRAVIGTSGTAKNLHVTGNLTVAGSYPTGTADWANPGSIGSTTRNYGAFLQVSAGDSTSTKYGFV